MQAGQFRFQVNLGNTVRPYLKEFIIIIIIIIIVVVVVNNNNITIIIINSNIFLLGQTWSQLNIFIFCYIFRHGDFGTFVTLFGYLVLP